MKKLRFILALVISAAALSLGAFAESTAVTEAAEGGESAAGAMDIGSVLSAGGLALAVLALIFAVLLVMERLAKKRGAEPKEDEKQPEEAENSSEKENIE